MRNLQQDSASFKDTATEGLKASLTTAIALAQILGAEDISDRLLAVKRDVVIRSDAAEVALPGVTR